MDDSKPAVASKTIRSGIGILVMVLIKFGQAAGIVPEGELLEDSIEDVLEDGFIFLAGLRVLWGRLGATTIIKGLF